MVVGSAPAMKCTVGGPLVLSFFPDKFFYLSVPFFPLFVGASVCALDELSKSCQFSWKMLLLRLGGLVFCLRANLFPHFSGATKTIIGPRAANFVRKEVVLPSHVLFHPHGLSTKRMDYLGIISSCGDFILKLNWTDLGRIELVRAKLVRTDSVRTKLVRKKIWLEHIWFEQIWLEQSWLE
jgi:hypothetical protein